MKFFIYTTLLLSIASFKISAETFIYSDSKFPYKITSRLEWETVTKDDTLFEMKVKGTGKVTHLKVKKYVIDSSFDPSTKEWSRWSFAINKEYATQFGKLGFVDSSFSKKIGNLRAYEIYSYYNLELDGRMVRWAQYDRWTEYAKNGFLVSIVADSADLAANYLSYKAILDSMNLEVVTKINHSSAISECRKIVLNNSIKTAPLYNDLLGRTVINSVNSVSGQHVTKGIRRLILW